MNKKTIQKWRALTDSHTGRGIPSLPRPVTAKVNCMRQRHTISLDLEGVVMHDHSSDEFEAIEAMDALSSAFGGGSQYNKKVSECRCQEIKTLSIGFLNGRYTQTNNQEKWKRLPKTFREELQRRWNVRAFRQKYQPWKDAMVDKLGHNRGYKNAVTTFGENLAQYQSCLNHVHKQFYCKTLGFDVVYANPHVVCKNDPTREFFNAKVVRRLQPSRDYFHRKEPHIVSVIASTRPNGGGTFLGVAEWKKVPVNPQEYTRQHYYNLTKSQKKAWKRRYAKGQKVWGWEITVDLEESDYERQ